MSNFLAFYVWGNFCVSSVLQGKSWGYQCVSGYPYLEGNGRFEELSL